MSNDTYEQDVAWHIMEWNFCNDALTSYVPAVSMRNTNPKVLVFYDEGLHLIWWLDLLRGQLSSVGQGTGRYLGLNVTLAQFPSAPGDWEWALDTKRSILYIAVLGTDDWTQYYLHVVDLRRRQQVGVYPIFTHDTSTQAVNGLVYDPKGDRLILNKCNLPGETSEYGVFEPTTSRFTFIAESMMGCLQATNVAVYDGRLAVQCGGAWPTNTSMPTFCEWLDLETNKTHSGANASIYLSLLTLDSSPNACFLC